MREADQPTLRLVANAGMLSNVLAPEPFRLRTASLAMLPPTGPRICARILIPILYALPFRPAARPGQIGNYAALTSRRGRHRRPQRKANKNAFSPNDITTLEALADQLRGGDGKCPAV